MPEILGEYTDRLTTTEMRVQGLPRGVIHKLYNAARQKLGAPLGILAATKLQEAVSPGDTVIISTGAGHDVWLPKGETDGPLGAAALARAVTKGLRAVPVLVGEEVNMEPLVAATIAAGLPVLDYEIAKQRQMAAAVQSFPLGAEAGEQAAAEIMERYRPAAVITIEKIGVNSEGIPHSVLGHRDTEMAQVHRLVKQARQDGAVTVGIGDGGNEIGFGTIHEAVREIMPYGAKCQCPCGAGNADTTVVDVLVVGATSNWGAYNVEACLAFLLDDPEVLHSPETEFRMLDACSRAGAADGLYATTDMIVDGTPAEVQTSIITILQTMVTNALKSVPRSF